MAVGKGGKEEDRLPGAFSPIDKVDASSGFDSDIEFVVLLVVVNLNPIDGGRVGLGSERGVFHCGKRPRYTSPLLPSLPKVNKLFCFSYDGTEHAALLDCCCTARRSRGWPGTGQETCRRGGGSVDGPNGIERISFGMKPRFAFSLPRFRPAPPIEEQSTHSPVLHP